MKNKTIDKKGIAIVLIIILFICVGYVMNDNRAKKIAQIIHPEFDIHVWYLDGSQDTLHIKPKYHGCNTFKHLNEVNLFLEQKDNSTSGTLISPMKGIGFIDMRSKLNSIPELKSDWDLEVDGINYECRTTIGIGILRFKKI